MIDLHTHTTVSDGGDSPSELVAKAAAAGLDAIAVTDHDNDAGCDEAVAAGREHGVEVVRGVEISCDVEKLVEEGYAPSSRPTMHLLGYFIPEDENLLSGALADLQYHRANRNREIVERLNELGIPVTFEEVEQEAGGPGSQIGRPHFAAVLVRHGAVSEYQEAFDEYLAKGAKAYISRKLYAPGEAVELMLSAGAVPVLAHPFTRHPGGFVDKNGRVHPIISEALARGLWIDVGHGSHFSFKMARIALDAGIVPHTLGADMHGYNTHVPKPAGTPDAHPDEEHMFFGQARFSLVSAMTAMMACGLTLEQVVPMVTSNPARMLRLEGQIGTLKPGVVADVSVLHDERGRWVLRDSEDNQVSATRLLRPAFCLRAGQRIEADASILPVAEVA